LSNITVLYRNVSVYCHTYILKNRFGDARGTDIPFTLTCLPFFIQYYFEILLFLQQRQ